MYKVLAEGASTAKLAQAFRFVVLQKRINPFQHQAIRSMLFFYSFDVTPQLRALKLRRLRSRHSKLIECINQCLGFCCGLGHCTPGR